MEKIICDHCNQQITKKDDLVVTTKYLFFLLKKYHRKCFADLVKMRTITSGFVRNRPINSLMNTLLLIISTIAVWIIGLFIIVGIELLFHNIGSAAKLLLYVFGFLIILIPIPSIIIRLLSYYKYEKKLSE